MAHDSSGASREKWAPPMASWSTEADLLASVHDAVQGVRYAVELSIWAQSGKGSKPKPPKSYPRPRTAMDKARADARLAKHKALAARVLPHRRPKGEAPD